MPNAMPRMLSAAVEAQARISATMPTRRGPNLLSMRWPANGSTTAQSARSEARQRTDRRADGGEYGEASAQRVEAVAAPESQCQARVDERGDDRPGDEGDLTVSSTPFWLRT